MKIHLYRHYLFIQTKDAHASSIELKLVNYGADLIEVSDNGNYHSLLSIQGSGIRSEDFASVALKYYTSKITHFDDIRYLQSFGFRFLFFSFFTHSGEALSCICDVSGEFSIVTRHQSAPIGTYIKYSPTGTILLQVSFVSDCEFREIKHVLWGQQSQSLIYLR